MSVPPLLFAITGGIATGKSYVTRRLRSHGIPIADADELARAVVEPGQPALTAIVERFGPGILDTAGTLNRPALAAIVFADPAARRDLEAITHPAIRHAITTFFATLPADTRLAGADIPLLYETGRQTQFARVVVAACPPEIQRQRVVARDGVSEAEAQRRIDAQQPIATKVAAADYVVWTAGSFAETDAQIDEVLARLRTEAGALR